MDSPWNWSCISLNCHQHLHVSIPKCTHYSVLSSLETNYFCLSKQKRREEKQILPTAKKISFDMSSTLRAHSWDSPSFTITVFSKSRFFSKKLPRLGENSISLFLVNCNLFFKMIIVLDQSCEVCTVKLANLITKTFIFVTWLRD